MKFFLKSRIIEKRQIGMQYKCIFDISNQENVQTSLYAVKRIGQHFAKINSITKKMGSGHPKATTKRVDQ